MKGKDIMSKRKTSQPAASDEQIIDMYWQRNPDAIQETDQKYGTLGWLNKGESQRQYE